MTGTLVQASKAELKASMEAEMQEMVGVAMETIGAAGRISSLARPGSAMGRLFGRPNPVKPNAAGNLQPYSAKTGQWLHNQANPGLGANPLTNISIGVVQGLAESAGGGAIDMPPPITRAQSLDQAVGRAVGSIRDIIK